jgi:hypothetical protein
MHQNKYAYIDPIEKLDILNQVLNKDFYINGHHIIFKLFDDKKDDFVLYFLNNNNIDLNIKKDGIALYNYLIRSIYLDYCIEKNIVKADSCYKNNIALIFEMIELKEWQIVEKLLKQDFDINIKYKQYNLLYYLIEYNKCADILDIVKILIDKKVNLNETFSDYIENTILNIAISKKDIRLIELFLKNNAKIDILNGDNNTDLLRLKYCSNFNFNTLKLLIQYRANINTLDATGKALIYYMIETNNLSGAEILVINGATIYQDCLKLKMTDKMRNVSRLVKSNLISESNKALFNNLQESFPLNIITLIQANSVSIEEKKSKLEQYVKKLIEFTINI